MNKNESEERMPLKKGRKEGRKGRRKYENEQERK